MKIYAIIITILMLFTAFAFTACGGAGDGGAAGADDGTYIVTFDSQDATVAADPGSKTVISPAAAVDSLPIPPVRTGYVFAGWYTGEGGSGTEFKAATKVKSDVTLYAYWSANPVYVVTYFVDGAIAGTMSVTYPATTVVTLPVDPVKSGYTFVGWYTAINGGGTEFTSATSVAEDINIYASWSANPVYTVTYKDNEEVVGTQHVTFPATTVSILLSPSKNGYNFAGWFTGKNSSGTAFTASTPVNADITIYAAWTVKTIFAIGETGPGGGTVFYVKNGGLHGLEAAPASTEWRLKSWGKFGTSVGGTSSGVEYGSSNTTAVVAVMNAAPAVADTAAQLCRSLTSGGYSDWFLPSKDELTLMYWNLHKAALKPLGGFLNTNYWSSSEYSSFTSEYAWVLAFNAGNTAYRYKREGQCVRAIRAF